MRAAASRYQGPARGTHGAREGDQPASEKAMMSA